MALTYTIDHEIVRQQITDAGGTPVLAKDVPEAGEEPGADFLHIAFGTLDDTMERLEWEEFFEEFEEEQMALVYDDARDDGEAAELRIISREEAENEFGAINELPDSGDPEELRSNLYGDMDESVPLKAPGSEMLDEH